MLLQDALDIALKMALSIPLADIMAYRKVARAYFALLDVLCHNHAQVRPVWQLVCDCGHMQAR